MQKAMTINGTEFNVVSLLGKGKGGYSYLAERDGKKFVLKQIHHEPCSYYTFGNKIEAEQNDYATLKSTGIRLPKLIDTDVKQERILKEFYRRSYGNGSCKAGQNDRCVYWSG